MRELVEPRRRRGIPGRRAISRRTRRVGGRVLHGAKVRIERHQKPTRSNNRVVALTPTAGARGRVPGARAGRGSGVRLRGRPRLGRYWLGEAADQRAAHLHHRRTRAFQRRRRNRLHRRPRLGLGCSSAAIGRSARTAPAWHELRQKPFHLPDLRRGLIFRSLHRKVRLGEARGTQRGRLYPVWLPDAANSVSVPGLQGKPRVPVPAGRVERSPG